MNIDFFSHNELVTKTSQFLDEFNSNDKLKIQTSGSTGKPKEFIIPKDRFLVSAKRTCDFFKLEKDDRAFLCISPEYIGGKMMIIRCLERNMNLFIGNLSAYPFEKETTADFAAFVPLQIHNIIKRDIGQLQKIKNIIIGGGPLNPEDEQILSEHQVNAFVTFGMTETLSHIALRQVGQKEYQVLPGIEIETDSLDRLIIKAPELTGVPQLITQDIIEIKPGNQFIWKGRADNVINSGGVKLYPEEIEKKLAPHIDLPFFISKQKDEKFGEKVILIIESDQPLDLHLESVLSKFEQPKSIYYCKSFIYTETEKINRNKTLDQLQIEG